MPRKSQPVMFPPVKGAQPKQTPPVPSGSATTADIVHLPPVFPQQFRQSSTINSVTVPQAEKSSSSLAPAAVAESPTLTNASPQPPSYSPVIMPRASVVSIFSSSGRAGAGVASDGVISSSLSALTPSVCTSTNSSPALSSRGFSSRPNSHLIEVVQDHLLYKGPAPSDEKSVMEEPDESEDGMSTEDWVGLIRSYRSFQFPQ